MGKSVLSQSLVEGGGCWHNGWGDNELRMHNEVKEYKCIKIKCN